MKRLISLIIVSIIIASTFFVVPISAGAIISGDFEYELLSDTTIEITGYTGLDADLSIPSDLDGYTVTSIGREAFAYCSNITSILIPDSVISIGDNAFYWCWNLNSVTIPDSVTYIGYYAFYGCDRLSEIWIPDSVTSIGGEAFYGCYSLTEVTIPKSVKSIGNNAFYWCDNLERITVLNPECDIYDLESFREIYYEGSVLYESYFGTIPDYVTIYGYDDSTAYKYAKKVGNEFESLGRIPQEPNEPQTEPTTPTERPTEPPTVPPTQAPNEPKMGDVDGDGTVSVMDATIIQRSVAQLTTIEDEKTQYADTNKDGKVSIMDATIVQRFVAQLIPEI